MWAGTPVPATRGAGDLAWPADDFIAAADEVVGMMRATIDRPGLPAPFR